MGRWGVLLLVVGAGCYEPPSDTCTIECTAGAVDACPPDQTCVGGFCVTPGNVCTTELAMVRAGGRHACGLDAKGHALCWGDGRLGQVGAAAVTEFAPAPTNVDDLTMPWIALATGNEHTCAIRANGTVWCWGQNELGETRGMGAGIANVPAQVAAPASAPAFAKISAGGAHSCAIGAGQLWCWGRPQSFGMNATVNSMTRVAPAISDFTEVAAGVDHTCAISTSMGVMCAGFNDQGQCGQTPAAVTIATFTAVNVGLPGTLFPIRIAAGDSKNCVIMGDAPDAVSGALWCWGYNMFHDVGDTMAGTVFPAKQTGPEVGWTQVSAGAKAVCGIRDHHAFCAGTSELGQLGDGVWASQRTPSQAIDLGPADEVYVSTETPVSVGDRGFSELGCARDGAHVQCWGSNPFGEVGNRRPALHVKPVAIASPNGAAWEHIWSATTHSCGQTSDDQLWCWGADSEGEITAQLSRGSAMSMPCTSTDPCDAPRPTPAPAAIGHPETLTIGDIATCALEAGAIQCWGGPDRGVLGALRSTPGLNTVTPPASQQWAKLFGGNNASCGLTTGGTLLCWGHVIDTDHTTPVAINDPLLADLATLQFGDAFACGAQTGQGRVCWGTNQDGEVGDGTLGGTQVAPMLYPDAVIEVASRGSHSCAVTGANQIACWGYNGRGECGQAATTNVTTPSLVMGVGQALAACKHVAIGDYFSCAICGGSPWCWGDNNSFRLGRADALQAGDFDEQAARVAVPTGTYTEISATATGACALDDAGTLYCWGYGGRGELGEGGHAVNVPTLIAPTVH